MTNAAPAGRSRASGRSRTTVLALALAGVTALSGAPALATVSTPAAPQAVIVTGGPGAAAAVVRAGGTVVDSLPLIGGVSALLQPGSALPAGFTVTADRTLRVAGTDTPTTDGPASTVRATLGLGAPGNEGSGSTVAVVDTGVADLPDLAGRVRHLNTSGGEPGDGYGHGTFVAGLIAGNGASSAGRYAGVAPGADILDVKVATGDGRSSLVQVLRGLQAVAGNPEVDVVNLSLSSGSPLPYQIDPLTQALEALWRRGVTVVVPAGNDGAKGAGSITSPGIDPVLLTVGGLDETATSSRTDDTIASWSSQGPAPQGIAKPEISAPGSHLISLAAPGSQVTRDNAASLVDEHYLKGSGTSFANAVTAGAAAVLIADRHRLQPDQVKRLLTGTAYEVAGAPTATGAGGLDLAAALAAPAPKVMSSHDNAPRGDRRAWSAFLVAMMSGNEQAATNSWDDLSPASRRWAARQWAELGPDVRQWAASSWAASSWASATPEEWAARQWAASSWAASSWAARQWAASSWAGTPEEWAASSWAASSWAARQWAASSWAASSWAARQWAASSWAASSWAASGWAASGWAASGWAASGWAARQWADSDWSARQWAASGWAASGWAASGWAASGWAASGWAASGWASTGWR